MSEVVGAEMNGSLESFSPLLEEFRSLNSLKSVSPNATSPPLHSPHAAALALAGASCYGGTEDFQLRTFLQESSTELSGLGDEDDEPRLTVPSEHLPEPGQSLPDLAGELAAAQSTQHADMSSKEETLLRLKAELQKEREHLASLNRHICSTAKAICLSKDDAAHLSLECDQLEKQLNAKVSVIQDLRLELREAKSALHSLESLRAQYKEKMNMHGERTREVEQKSPVQQELEAVQRKISELKERGCGYMSGEALEILRGERQEALQDQIAKADATRELLAEENAGLERKAQSGREYLDQLRREVEVAKRKHQAQVTRMCRQLQEAQARRRQWSEKAQRLRITVHQLRQKIEE